MSVRRGEYARLKAAGWTATGTSPGQAVLVGRRWSR
jgi:hypothetical protein